MKRAVIVEIVRTPFAKAREGGALEGIHPVDLLATCLEAIVDPSGIQSNLIDDVIVGVLYQRLSSPAISREMRY